MHETPNAEITELLHRVTEGDAAASERLLVLVYAELRRLAGLAMRGERYNHTLQPTVLVHEAYVRLLGETSLEWTDRQHFFHTAARTMRRILKDYARAVRSRKRSGGTRVDLDQALIFTDTRAESYLALDEALERLEQLEPRQSQIVELKYFAGLTNDEIAHAIGRDVRTVKRDWQMARAWLHGQLTA
jgi:RNA polymerase sigma factor (TIGR02999 family)